MGRIHGALRGINRSEAGCAIIEGALIDLAVWRVAFLAPVLASERAIEMSEENKGAGLQRPRVATPAGPPRPSPTGAGPQGPAGIRREPLPWHRPKELEDD
ncbi:MAG TPA: hypothetical protein VED85_04025, partial [Burkholderiaceae bacterium]|nr:hypothetical protein [Burkholderiaceae bacterium]